VCVTKASQNQNSLGNTCKQTYSFGTAEIQRLYMQLIMWYFKFYERQYKIDKIIIHTFTINILQSNIDLNLQNKLHGPMNYKIGVTCVFNGHKIYTLL